jgi:hypothetical protein
MNQRGSGPVNEAGLNRAVIVGKSDNATHRIKE